MKNIKNLLITGIALTIALVASVQVVAMEQQEDKPYYQLNPENPKLDETRTINPHLTRWDRLPLWQAIRDCTNEKQEIKNSKNPKFIADAAKRTRRDAELQAAIDIAKLIYYGDKKYSGTDLQRAEMHIRNIMVSGS